ncbi:MAG: cytochrome P450 [Rhodospirillaceae bacterium]|nr:MAG: cytochrome P450 [Rhodospirillaceae bacterium]
MGFGKESLLSASLSDKAINDHPGEFYHAMRIGDPVHYDEKLGLYLVSRYQDVQQVLKDPTTFSMKKGYEEQYAKGFAEEFKEILMRDGGGFFPDAIMSDPPEHTRVRKLLDKAFSPHRIATLEPLIAERISGMIEKLADKGKMEAIEDFAAPMTIVIICEQLGITEYDPVKIRRWSSAITAQIGRMQDREQMRANAREVCDLQNFLIGHIRKREANRTDDMISDLIYAETDDPKNPRLTFHEVVSLVRALLIAGNETTATALGNLFFVLATRPEVANQMYETIDADDPRLLMRFMEELLRIEPPVRGLTRMTTKEVMLGGKLLPANAHMIVLFASANDDESEFPCPRNFDTTRGNLGRHMTFGAGVHRCVGLTLARMEIKVAAKEIVKRIKDIKLACPVEDLTYLQTVATRSLTYLPLTFSRRQ